MINCGNSTFVSIDNFAHSFHDVHKKQKHPNNDKKWLCGDVQWMFFFSSIFLFPTQSNPKLKPYSFSKVVPTMFHHFDHRHRHPIILRRQNVQKRFQISNSGTFYLLQRCLMLIGVSNYLQISYWFDFQHISMLLWILLKKHSQTMSNNVEQCQTTHFHWSLSFFLRLMITYVLFVVAFFVNNVSKTLLQHDCVVWTLFGLFHNSFTLFSLYKVEVFCCASFFGTYFPLSAITQPSRESQHFTSP